MYFKNFIQSNPQIKPYKLKYLNDSFLKDFWDLDEITTLSKTERELVIKSFQEEIEIHKSIKSVDPIKTGAGNFISKNAQNTVISKTQNIDLNNIFNSDAKSIFKEEILKDIQNICKILHFELLKLLYDKGSKTWKALFRLYDNKKIESVMMKFDDGRNSVCVSSQVGCPVGCVFCASGQMGFMRNLTSHEIVDQVLFWSKLLKILPNDKIDKKFSKIAENNTDTIERVTNIVYMGMGEPMLNYDNVVESLKILTNPEEFGLGDRHITVSSSGYIPQLQKYMQEGLKTRLAISLHAPNQELRAKLMPVARIYKLDKLMEFIKEYEHYTNKRISYEYTMIEGVNDTEECARDLSRLLRHREAHVNLIPMNPIATTKTDLTIEQALNSNEYYKGPMGKSNILKISRFNDILKEHFIPTTIRITMGDKIQAACGQLANEN